MIRRKAELEEQRRRREMERQQEQALKQQEAMRRQEMLQQQEIQRQQEMQRQQEIERQHELQRQQEQRRQQEAAASEKMLQVQHDRQRLVRGELLTRMCPLAFRQFALVAGEKRKSVVQTQSHRKVFMETMCSLNKVLQ